MYMDIHEVPGVTADAVATAHLADLKTQGKYGVEYHKYWLNEAQGKIFCLCSAPNAEAANAVHREAHGLVAQKLIEVAPELAESFLGDAKSIRWGPRSFPEPRNAIAVFAPFSLPTSLTRRNLWNGLAMMPASH